MKRKQREAEIALHYAIRNLRVDEVKQLLEAGVDPNAFDDKSRNFRLAFTALCTAEKGFIEVVRLLCPVWKGKDIASLGLALACLVSILAASTHGQPLLLKTETFDVNPGWEGRNNRATDPSPRTIVQNFGFSSTSNAGGPAGEIGGFITPAGEPAFYGKVITPASFNDPVFASGILNVPEGGGHTLIGFFNTNTVNEWRTPNTVALRIYGRGTYFHAYPEYGTALWRAGSGALGGEAAIPTGTNDYPFSLNYDPNGAGGQGTITATLGSYSNFVTLDAGHKADGAMFNRFGILNVMKSADDSGTIWLDNVTINGEAHSFDSNPGWDQRNNRTNYISTNVRPRFDFGYSPGTIFAGGQRGGEIGGHTFRGDSRVEFSGARMAYYGARLNETLSLNHPLHAEGKIGFRRGVSDSTTLIGFFHSTGSMRSNNSQNSATPENFVGAAIEGPSAEGFYLYPTYGLDQEGVRADGGRGTPTPPYIYPDGESRDWALDYNPDGNIGTGSITVTLDGQAVTLNLDSGHKQIGAWFNRFGIITTHIDGSGQTVYFDDLTYTIGSQPGLTIARTAPAQARLQWPTNYIGFMAQSATTLGAPSLWQPITSVVTVNGGLYTATIGMTNAARFFRLRKP